jgi:hypothetical protein
MACIVTSSISFENLELHENLIFLLHRREWQEGWDQL